MARGSVRWLVVMLAAAFLTAACGGGGTSGTAQEETNGLENKTSAEVLRAAVDALEEVGSVHLIGTGTSAGQSGQVDMRIQGASCAGSLTISGARVDLTLVDDVVYVKTDQAGWQALGVPAGASTPYAGRWVKTPANTDMAQGFTIASLADQLAQHGNDMRAGVQPTTLNGTKVVSVSNENGEKLYVANTGKALPLRLSSSTTGNADLREHRVEFDITAPADAVEMTTP